ncbi:ATP-binding cassette domain-containing protein [Arthrobacter sp. RHLT1-20]
MPDGAVSTRALVKRYHDVTIVGSLDLDVRRGEVFGFLGTNGAGKKTTIRMLPGRVSVWKLVRGYDKGRQIHDPGR